MHGCLEIRLDKASGWIWTVSLYHGTPTYLNSYGANICVIALICTEPLKGHGGKKNLETFYVRT